MRVTFIRHAEAESNVKNNKHEYTVGNCGLSDFGKKQANHLDLSFDLLIISPLRRAIETYVHSNIKSRRTIICDLFREHKKSRVNFLENESLIEETEKDFIDRIFKAVEYIKNLKKEDSPKNVGIIGHANFIWNYTRLIINKPILLRNTEYISLDM